MTWILINNSNYPFSTISVLRFSLRGEDEISSLRRILSILGLAMDWLSIVYGGAAQTSHLNTNLAALKFQFCLGWLYGYRFHPSAD